MESILRALDSKVIRRVAVVHDWLTTNGGAERVLEQILACYPEAQLYCLVDFLPTAERGFLNGRQVKTSFLQNLPFGRAVFRKLAWLLPCAVESLDVSAYDLVISSSYAVAKGILTGPGQLHICYCHSPIRYAWDLQHEYLREAGLTRGLRSIYARTVLHYLRLWDVRTSNGVDCFVANSRFVAERIAKVYRRRAVVIHPPVNLSRFQLQEYKDDYFITVSRLVPYKRVDLIVEAFRQMPHRRLIVIGDGPEFRALTRLTTPNIELLGFQNDSVVQQLVAKARAFVFAAQEDFGIAVVEAQAAGTPVICFGRGGVRDSVIPGRTGLFFDEQTPASLISAIDAFEVMHEQFDPLTIRRHAEHFNVDTFRRRLQEVVDRYTEGKGDSVEETGPTRSLPTPSFASRPRAVEWIDR